MHDDVENSGEDLHHETGPGLVGLKVTMAVLAECVHQNWLGSAIVTASYEEGCGYWVLVDMKGDLYDLFRPATQKPDVAIAGLARYANQDYPVKDKSWLGFAIVTASNEMCG
jgi:hypothetical protein